MYWGHLFAPAVQIRLPGIFAMDTAPAVREITGDIPSVPSSPLNFWSIPNPRAMIWWHLLLNMGFPAYNPGTSGVSVCPAGWRHMRPDALPLFIWKPRISLYSIMSTWKFSRDTRQNQAH